MAEEERQLWSSRFSFIMASVGAAVGFGNIWRFPALAYGYGGGAFFIPYLIALFFIGIPILILEIGLGQYYRTGDIGVFGGIHKRLYGVGFSSVICTSCIVCYYIPLIAWTVNMFFSSFTNFDEKYAEGNAYAHFLYDIIGMPKEGLMPNKVMWVNFGYLVLVYAMIFLIVGFGVKVTGRVAHFTMGFPILLLFIFLIRAATLPGASSGVKVYIGQWDMAVLSERPDVWSTAVGQIFFSIGVTFGIFTAYGSVCPKDAPVVANSFIIALSNSFFSFIAGFAVFATIGSIAEAKGIPVEDAVTAGPGLVFGAYPEALTTLPNGEHWVRIFLVFLFLLGIDSGFGLLEAVLIVIHDSKLGENYSKMTLTFGFSTICLLVGLLFVTDAGFFFLDVVDYYVNFIMLLVGFMETFGAGWVFGIEDQIAKVGSGPVFSFMAAVFVPVFLGSGLWFGLPNNALWGGFVGFFLTFFVGMAITYSQAKSAAAEKGMTVGEVFTTLTTENVLSLRDRISTSLATPLPTIWALGIKFFVAPILLICFFNLCNAKMDDGTPVFGGYEGYPTYPFQFIGILIVCLALGFLSLGALAPQVLAGVLRDDIKESVKKLNEPLSKEVDEEEEPEKVEA